MRYSSYLLFPLFFTSKSTAIKPTTIIKNSNIPCCKNCIFFEPSVYNSDSLNKCNKFGEKNIVTGEITKDFANSCRKQEEKCGFTGKYYIKESDLNLRLKSIKYQINNNWHYLFVSSMLIIYINILISKN
jgi:hypothetical protein